MKELISQEIKVRVSFDRATREYTVTPYYWVNRQGWKAHNPAAYFTPDKADAWETAHVMYKTFKKPE